LADFVPGWDCHGLPIERQVDKQLGAKKRELSVGKFRRACREYAEEQIDLQRKDFKRLGILARWDHPYKTMDFRYEADIVRELSQFARRGALYRRKRPVHWCPVDVTALAEAEGEYADKTSPSIYVRLPGTAPAPRGWCVGTRGAVGSPGARCAGPRAVWRWGRMRPLTPAPVWSTPPPAMAKTTSTWACNTGCRSGHR